MASLPVIPGAVKVTLVWSLVGQASATTSFGITTSLTDMSAIFTAVDSHIAQGMWGALTGLASVTQVELFRYDGVTPTFIQAVSGAKYTGGAGAADDALIAPAVLVSLRTASRGPNARGRIFLPFVSEQTTGNGSIVPADVPALQAAWDAFRTGMSGGGTPMAVISLSTNTTVSPPRSPTARSVVSLTVEGHLGTQRRRQTRLRRA